MQSSIYIILYRAFDIKSRGHTNRGTTKTTAANKKCAVKWNLTLDKGWQRKKRENNRNPCKMMQSQLETAAALVIEHETKTIYDCNLFKANHIYTHLWGRYVHCIHARIHRIDTTRLMDTMIIWWEMANQGSYLNIFRNLWNDVWRAWILQWGGGGWAMIVCTKHRKLLTIHHKNGIFQMIHILQYFNKFPVDTQNHLHPARRKCHDANALRRTEGRNEANWIWKHIIRFGVYIILWI